MSKALTRFAKRIHVGKLWLCCKCKSIFIVKLPSWQPTPGVKPNWYLTLCSLVMRNMRAHRMLLNILDSMSIRVTPCHLFGSLRSPILGTGTTWPSYHLSKVHFPAPIRVRELSNTLRFWLESSLKASWGTLFRPGDFSFANFLTDCLTSIHLTWSLIPETVSC